MSGGSNRGGFGCVDHADQNAPALKQMAVVLRYPFQGGLRQKTASRRKGENDVPIQSVSIGSVVASSSLRDSDYVISAVFTFPTNATPGVFDLSIVFQGAQGEADISFTESHAFTIGATGSLTVTIQPAGAVTDGAKWSVDFGQWQESGATVTGLLEGTHELSFSAVIGWDKPADKTVTVVSGQRAQQSAIYSESAVALSYPVVDTGQDTCFDDSGAISCPLSGEAFDGQDAQHGGYQFSYQYNGDGTVSDLLTGLMWQRTADTDGDGDIDADDKLTPTEAQSYCDNLRLGRYTDWRLPDIKQLYSLIDFRGEDCSGYEGTDTSVLTPFIDTSVFDYNWGDTSAGERLIDSQYVSDTLYVDTTANQGSTVFGVNFADGRIKGYGSTIGSSEKTFFCMCVRDNTDASSITNEAGQADYPYYWTSTTHLKYAGGFDSGVYISFGRAMGDYGQGGGWEDVHGAGAQRSDPKAPEAGVSYPNSHGPQGDAQRVYNYVRLVRDVNVVASAGELADLMVILKILAGISTADPWNDVVSDGKATMEDAISILKDLAN